MICILVSVLHNLMFCLYNARMNLVPKLRFVTFSPSRGERGWQDRNSENEVAADWCWSYGIRKKR